MAASPKGQVKFSSDESRSSPAAGSVKYRTDRSESSEPAESSDAKSRNLFTWLLFAARVKRSRFSSGQSWVSRGKVEYTPDKLTKCIYNPDTHTPKFGSNLLSISELIALETLPANEDPPKGLFRFPTDERAAIVECLTMAVVVLSFILWPCTFIWGGTWKDPTLIPGQRKLLVADLILDITYAVCLLLNFNMSYMHHRKGYEVVTRTRIRRHLTSNPTFWISMLSTTTYFWIILGAPMLINNFKIIRARHLLDVPDALWRLRDRSAVRLARPVILLVGASHWVACLLGYFGGYREAILQSSPDDFKTSFEDHRVDGYWSLYLMALVEAVYMLTGALDNPVGDGGVRDKQFGALIMVSIFGPIGCVVVALFISAIVRERGMAMALDARHEENKAFMQHAMRILNIPKALQNRVLSLHYYQKMGHDMEAFHALFNKKNLSRALENALLVYLYRDTVCTSPYFMNKDPNYIIEVLRVLEFEVFIPGDYVGRRGEIASSMYFVSRGVCAILVPDPVYKSNVEKAKQVGMLGTGDYFGEVALVDDTLRTAWVRADSYALLSALHRDSIVPIWKHFPEEQEELRQVVQEKHKKDRQRLNKHRWKMGYAGAKMMSSGMTMTDSEFQMHAEEATGEQSDGGNGHAAPNSQEAPSRRNSNRRGSTDGGFVGRHASVREMAELRENIAEILSRQAALEDRVDRVLENLRPPSVSTSFEKVEDDVPTTRDPIVNRRTNVKGWKKAKAQARKDESLRPGLRKMATGAAVEVSISDTAQNTVVTEKAGSDPGQHMESPTMPSRSWRRTSR